MVETYGTSLARVTEVTRGMLVRQSSGFQIAVDISTVGRKQLCLALSDGSRIMMGRLGLVEVAR